MGMLYSSCECLCALFVVAWQLFLERRGQMHHCNVWPNISYFIQQTLLIKWKRSLRLVTRPSLTMISMNWRTPDLVHNPRLSLLLRLPRFTDAPPLLETLPYSIRILLEAAVRNCDNFQVLEGDVEKILSWNETAGNVEIPFKPARVILQDFTYAHYFILYNAEKMLLQRSTRCGWPCCHARCHEGKPFTFSKFILTQPSAWVVIPLRSTHLFL